MDLGRDGLNLVEDPLPEVGIFELRNQECGRRNQFPAAICKHRTKRGERDMVGLSTSACRKNPTAALESRLSFAKLARKTIRLARIRLR